MGASQSNCECRYNGFVQRLGGCQRSGAAYLSQFENASRACVPPLLCMALIVVPVNPLLPSMWSHKAQRLLQAVRPAHLMHSYPMLADGCGCCSNPPPPPTCRRRQMPCRGHDRVNNRTPLTLCHLFHLYEDPFPETQVVLSRTSLSDISETVALAPWPPFDVLPQGKWDIPLFHVAGLLEPHEFLHIKSVAILNGMFFFQFIICHIAQTNR